MLLFKGFKYVYTAARAGTESCTDIYKATLTYAGWVFRRVQLKQQGDYIEAGDTLVSVVTLASDEKGTGHP